MNKVFISKGDSSYELMFKSKGWELVQSVAESDLVQFTGGEDVSPSFYGEPDHVSTYYNLNRDLSEKIIYKEALSSGIPMAGICRGSQFLNVMCGGSLFQDVTKHAIGGGHLATTKDGRTMTVTSTHHQMMIPHNHGDVLLTAHQDSLGVIYDPLLGEFKEKRIELDVEAVLYSKQKVLCFQPHPEFLDGEMRDLYFEFLKEIL